MIGGRIATIRGMVMVEEFRNKIDERVYEEWGWGRAGPVEVVVWENGSFCFKQLHSRSIESFGDEDRLTVSGGGVVWSYTTIYDPPAGYEDMTPYSVGLVKLNEGPIILARLTEVSADELEIGLLVRLVMRKLRVDEEGYPVYGWMFRPKNDEGE